MDNSHYFEPCSGIVSTNQVSKALDTEHREMQRTLELLNDGGVGYIPEKKRNGWVRIMFENWNSLGIHTHSWKLDRLNYLVRKLNIDVIAGCECQTDWTMVDRDNQFHSLLTPGHSTKGLAAHNLNERIQRDQMGGTAVSGVGRICDVITEVGADKTGLGRWSWVTLSGGTSTTHIISAYLPHKPNKHSRGRTVWEQHARFFEARGDMRYPSNIFIIDLLTVIQDWTCRGDHIILAIDANQDVYTGKLAKALNEDPINMTCLLQRAMGEPVPNSHFSGTGKISTIFGSPGVVTGHGMCYPHWYGIGDHRAMVVEISAHHAFGGTYPTIATAKARTLSCRTSRHKRIYCDKLRRLTSSHNMHERLIQIQEMTGDEYIQAHNKWDSELGDYMRSAEIECSHYRDGSISYSPTVGQWLKRRSILKWILRWHEGKVPDVRNLLRAAKRISMDTPLQITKQEVEARLVACIEEVYKLKHQAPALRIRHLKWRLNLSQQRQDDQAAQEITRIMKTEVRKRQQRLINRAIKDPRGRAVIRVEIDTTSGTRMLDTQEEVETHVRSNLTSRFSLGTRAPLNQGHFLQDFGQLGNTHATTQLLQGNYTFPNEHDQATADFLREAARTYKEISTYPEESAEVTVSEYTNFWKTAKEEVSSSKSGRHFGHYKTICSDPELVLLQVANINLAASRGVPLTRWGEGVTVLLEKAVGASRIDKLRAICLLEADFNWWLKIIFARRMMHSMKSKGAIPSEQGAVKGRTTTDTSLMKQLFLDQANMLHEDCALASTDAANCYDAVNHTAASISLQAFGVDPQFVQCYLKNIQGMRYYLRTGYGLSQLSYGGSTSQVCMGLTQGSGAAPAVWTAVSTIIVGAYKQRGFGAQLRSGWSGETMPLAALLYVDDTDLLHTKSATCDSETTLSTWVQEATDYWAHLLQATGGNLKPSKCYWYLMQYTFDDGIARLLAHKELLRKHHHLSIPQPDGSTVDIALKDPTEATMVLGVMVCPTGDGMPMLSHMLSKGYKWSTRVLRSTLRHKDTWLSFRTQAIMSVRYGLVPLMASRQAIDDKVSSWYYTCLPALGVNRSIGREWRQLPSEYQGLGLPNLSLEKLADSLRLIQHHWGRNTELGRALRLSFELVQVETGLSGNFLARKYDVFGCLATHTWLKGLWELIHYYRVEVRIQEDMSIPTLRENDKVLMEEVIKILPRQQWASFNRARKYFKVYFLSHLIAGDGVTVHPTALDPTLAAHQTSRMSFPKECPNPSDFNTWINTIRLLTSATLTLPTSLGKFCRPCPESLTWQTNCTHSHIVERINKDTFRIYRPSASCINTRRRHLFEYSHTTTQPPLCTLTASVIPQDHDHISLHSTCSIKPHTPATKTSFLSKLQQGSPSQLWRHMEIEADGEWIPAAIDKGSLVIVHDGSYMPQVDKTVCSAGVVLVCTHSGHMGRIKICEKTNSSSASNYRGELLGALIASHILCISNAFTSSATKVHLHCDNMGVVHHASHPESTLKSNQAQADILAVIARNLEATTTPWEYHHVYGHLDANTEFSQLTIPQQMNVIADSLAREALLEAIEMGQYCKPFFPNEPIRLMVGGAKITSSIKASLYHNWGHISAKELFAQKGIVHERLFNCIHWDGLHLLMTSLPQMYKVWVTKHVAGACATHRHLSKMNPQVINRCSCCGRRNESTLHITRCMDTGRSLMFQASTNKLIQWMIKSQSHPEITDSIQLYLQRRGRITMKQVCHESPTLLKFAYETDRLGWRNFTEARVSKELFHIQDAWLRQVGSRWHIDTWTKGFLTRLLDITHQQWLYRNARIHIRHVEGLTIDEHSKVMHKVYSLLGTDPMDLLPQHRSLLNVDFEALGDGSTTDRQYWIAQLESALSAQKRRLVNSSEGCSNKRQRKS